VQGSQQQKRTQEREKHEKESEKDDFKRRERKKWLQF
jgi:hypothetical protein